VPRKKNFPEFEVVIESLNERGYGLASFEGKKIQVLNALPGEKVRVKVFKKKKGWLFATAEDILTPSPHRIPPVEEHFTSCSPWQIMDYEYEKEIKQSFLKDLFKGHQIDLPNSDFYHPPSKNSYGYRNKVEYSFYIDDQETLHYAFFKREGGFGKFAHQGCKLVPDKVNQQAVRFLEFLNQNQVSGKDLKSVIFRYSFSQDKVYAGLFLKSKLDLDWLKFVNGVNLAGFQVAYSNPLSPASVITEVLYEFGNMEVVEGFDSLTLSYPFEGFFQVNPPAFNETLKDLREIVKGFDKAKDLTLIDLYSGVGTIGLGLAGMVRQVVGVEEFEGSKDAAMQNAKFNNISNFEAVEARSEDVLEYISQADVLVVDPPRIGLHQKVVNKILEVRPKYLIYLSCNPVTQAGNLSDLKDIYNITYNKAYNYYPRTPHVENLVVCKSQ
jgi:23S rRNA (uracil1939-C5)-methyltransferase